MKRIAIILSAPGGYDDRTDRLEGIVNDIDNWKNFLSSNIGGAWEESENEIIVIEDPTPEDINDIDTFFYNNDFDFLFLTFSGHGGYDEMTQKNAYYINNIVIPENNFLFNVDRQLTIFDACRVSEENIFGLKCFSAGDTHIIKSSVQLREKDLRKQYKKMYNDAILRLPQMEERLYSCSIDETAGDVGYGGLFTLKLMNAVKFISRSKKGIITTNQAFTIAKKETINARRGQNPQCLLSRTPFPIGISL
jgi:hypothetical protein